MTNKDICNNIADFIAIAELPLIVNGAVYKERRGTVVLTTDIRDEMLELMARSHCRQVEFGSYDCYIDTGLGFSCDFCLSAEVLGLNNNGIETVGCCCGHGRMQGFIQVHSGYVEAIRSKGYKVITEDENGNGKWCFVPKTKLPQKQ